MMEAIRLLKGTCRILDIPAEHPRLCSLQPAIPLLWTLCSFKIGHYWIFAYRETQNPGVYSPLLPVKDYFNVEIHSILMIAAGPSRALELPWPSANQGSLEAYLSP
jgi:hypothetical protein